MPPLTLPCQDGLEIPAAEACAADEPGPQITPPLLSCGRLHLAQSRSGKWSERLPGSMAGALTGCVVTRG